MCECLNMYGMYVQRTQVGTHEEQRMASDPLELDLQLGVNLQIGSVNYRGEEIDTPKSLQF